MTGDQPTTVAEWGRWLLDGPGIPTERLEVAAREAAALVGSGQADRTGAVTVLYVSAMAAGIPSGRAFERLADAMRAKAGTP